MDKLVLDEDLLTQERIKATVKAFEEKRAIVVEKLLNAVVDVQPVLHINAELKLNLNK
jgi:hypothetical protein